MGNPLSRGAARPARRPDEGWILRTGVLDQPFVACGPKGERVLFGTFEEGKAWIDCHPHPRRWHCDTLRTCAHCLPDEGADASPTAETSRPSTGDGSSASPLCGAPPGIPRAASGETEFGLRYGPYAVSVRLNRHERDALARGAQARGLSQSAYARLLLAEAEPLIAEGIEALERLARPAGFP
jgi:hypothetical protein